MDEREIREAFRELVLRALLGVDGPRERTIHKHRCDRCRTVWQHMTPGPEATDEDYARAHLCPRGCGIEQREKYRGPEGPDEETE